LTANQQNALNAAQIRDDMVRRNLTAALQDNLSNQGIVGIINAMDTTRQAAGQTIEVTPDALLTGGMIPGTTGLTVKSTTTAGPVKVPSLVKPPKKNG
jgi:hypothetical protein